MARRIPIALFFAFAILVIITGFVAVILLLTIRQREAYVTSINEQIMLSQMKANSTILEPLLQRETPLNLLAEKMISYSSGYLATDDDNFTSLIPWFNDAILICREPSVSRVFQLITSSNLDPTGAPYLSTTFVTPTLNMGGISINGNGRFNVMSPYPITKFTTEDTGYSSPLDPREDPGFRNFTMPTHKYWIPAVIRDDLTLELSVGFMYGIPVRWDDHHQSTGGLYLSVNMNYIRDLLINARATDESTTLLFDYQWSKFIASTDATLPLYDPITTFTIDIEDLQHSKYLGAYHEAIARCPPGDCEYSSFDLADDIVSALWIRTPAIHFFLIQLTPRDYFFGEWNKNLYIGICVGGVAGLSVLAVCTVLWFIISRSINTLMESMLLSSEMLNEEAHLRSSSAPSILSEIQAIQSSFEAMNHRLLLSKPYLPQSLLVAAKQGGEPMDYSDIGEEEDEEGEIISMEQIRSPLSPAHAPSTGSDRASFANRTSRRTSHNISVSESVLPRGLKSSKGTMNNKLIARNVAILAINVRNFHEMTRRVGPEAAQRIHSSLCNVIEQRANTDKGIIDAFHGDRFTVTFNVARMVTRPAQAAAMVALGIVDDLEVQQLLGQRHPLSMGLSCGRALVGNMGTDTIKKLCTIGSVVTEAMALEKVAKWAGTPCVMSDKAKIESEYTIRSFYVGHAIFPSPSESQLCDPIPTQIPTKSHPSHGTGLVREVFAVMQRVPQNGTEEWLYAIGSDKSNDPFAMIEKGLRSELSNDFVSKLKSSSSTPIIFLSTSVRRDGFESDPTNRNETVSPRTAQWAKQRAQVILAMGEVPCYDLTR